MEIYWLSGSVSIDCRSTKPVACPNILLPTVLNGEGRSGSQVFIQNFSDVIACCITSTIHLCRGTEAVFCKYTCEVGIVYSGVWNFIQDNFTIKT